MAGDVNEFRPESGFRRALLTVLTGAAIAQAIPILLSPVLTRLYDPHSMGMLAYYVAWMSILSVLATGRLEMAVMLPHRDEQAFDLVLGALGLTLVSGMLLFALIGSLHQSVSLPLDGLLLDGWLYLLPLSLVAAGAFQVLSYWQNRRGGYRRLVLARTSLAAATGGSQVVAGLLGAGAGGLIVGAAVGQAVGCGLLVHAIKGKWNDLGIRASIPRAVRAVRGYGSFMAFVVPGQLANVASALVPVLLLGFAYGAPVAGFYSLAERVLFAPIAIVGSAVGDVYRQHAAMAYAATGHCRPLFVVTLKRLALVGFAPALALMLWGPELFALVFGEPWREAGEIARLLAVTMFFQTIATPLSQTVFLAGMHRWDMAWQFARLVVSISTILVASRVSGDYRLAVALFAGGFAVLYMVQTMMQYRAASGSVHRTSAS